MKLLNKFKNKIGIIFLLIIVSIFPILSLFHSGLPLTHDGQDHVARIANFYQSLSEGNLVPRWAGNLNWGYGHPILEFLYPLPSYIASFFHTLGMSLVDSTKIVFATGMILSLLFMYLWLSQFLGKYASFFGAVLYTYAPYRFVELYVRGDIGENLAFAFIPLVLYFIYKTYKKPNIQSAILGGVSLSILILSHNAISLMFVPFIIVYGLLLLYTSKERKKYFKNLVLIMVVGFSISCFFWLPALIEGKYTLRNIVTKGAYISSFVNFKNLIYGPWSYGGSGQFTVQFGVFQWIALLLSPLLILKTKGNKEKFFLNLTLLIYSLFAIFLMLFYSNFIWEKILLLQNFQFPWRFLAIIVFSLSVLTANLMDLISKRINTKYITLVLVISVLIISSFYAKPKGYLYKSPDFYRGIYKSTTDTGESSPIWSIRFMEQIPKAPLDVIDGNAVILDQERNSTEHKYQITVNKKTLFRENTLYFPGWNIYANGNNINVEFQNMQYRGVMLFTLNKGTYLVDVIYKETKLRFYSDVISLVAIIFVIFLPITMFVKRKVY